MAISVPRRLLTLHPSAREAQPRQRSAVRRRRQWPGRVHDVYKEGGPNVYTFLDSRRGSRQGRHPFNLPNYADISHSVDLRRRGLRKDYHRTNHRVVV